MSYFQLDKRVLDSSIYRYGTPVEWKVWTHLLMKADPRNGVFEGLAWLIASDTNISEPEVEAALVTLESPDPRSRSTNDDGRKIRREGDKITIINYIAFRDKNHDRARMKRWRERKRAETLRNVSDTSRNVTETPGDVAETQNKNKNKNKNKRTTDNGNGLSAAVAAAGAKAPVDRWNLECCDDWNERFGDGTAPGGRITNALKPLVDRYGWETIRPAWRRYLSEKDPEFVNPQDFASKLMIWMNKHVAPADAKTARSREVLMNWLAQRREGGP